MFLEWILSNPSLGLHVRRLDHLATLSEYIAYDEFGPLVSPRQFSIYVLALAQITPNLVSIKVDPFRPEITSCFQHLARQSHLQEIHLASFPPEDREEDVGFVCWSFLAGLERSRIHSLALPFFDDAFAVPADAPRALAFEVEHLVIGDWITEGVPDQLDRYFDFGRVRSFTHNPAMPVGLCLSLVRHFIASLEHLKIDGRPPNAAPWDIGLGTARLSDVPVCGSLTRLTLRRVVLHSSSLITLPSRFPRLELLDLSDCELHDCCVGHPDVVLDMVKTLPRLRDLRFRSITHGDSQDLRRLATHCAARGIDFRGGMP